MTSPQSSLPRTSGKSVQGEREKYKRRIASQNMPAGITKLKLRTRKPNQQRKTESKSQTRKSFLFLHSLSAVQLDYVLLLVDLQNKGITEKKRKVEHLASLSCLH